MKLHDLKPAPGTQKRRIRVGRGIPARRGQTVELPDDPAVRGQIRAVRYLVSYEEVAAAPAKKKPAASKKEEAEA